MNRLHPEQESILTPRETSPQKQEIFLKEEALQEEVDEQKLIRGRQAEDTSGILITGRMTLRELEEQTGLSGRTIADRLGLPSSVSLDEHLGRLRRRYGFTLQEIRDLVATMLEK